MEWKSSWKIPLAFAVAALADLLQIFLFPLFFEGALSPVNNGLDVAVAGLMAVLLGWHWVFLPSFVGEMIPGLDLAPFWTTAVLWVVFKKKKAEAPRIETQEPAPKLLK